MKKFFALLLALAAVLTCFASCGGGGEDVITLPPETVEDPANDIFAFVSGGVIVKMGDLFYGKAGCLCDKLPATISSSSSPSCAFLGLDRTFVYNGFKVMTYPENDLDYVLTVEFTDDGVTTPAGIHIGSTEAELTAAYGEGAKNSNMIVFTRDKTSITVLLADGVVTNLQYDYLLD